MTLPILRCTVQPTVEPVELAEVKSWCRVDTSDDDTLLRSILIGARQWCEEFTGRQFVTATYTYSLDTFRGSRVYLPRPPLIAISGITYTDSGGTQQTWGATLYQTVTDPTGGYVQPAWGQTWPGDVRGIEEAVVITYTAGYGARGDLVPMPIRQAMLILCCHAYEIRTPIVIGTISTPIQFSVESLLWPYRAMRFD
jgi:uncharacterized phiE125 gp8 family phage protein